MKIKQYILTETGDKEVEKLIDEFSNKLIDKFNWLEQDKFDIEKRNLIYELRESIFNQTESEGFDFVEYLKERGFEENKQYDQSIIQYYYKRGNDFRIKTYTDYPNELEIGYAGSVIYSASIPQSRYEAVTLFKLLNIGEKK